MREKTEDKLTWLAEQKKNKLITKAKDIIAPSQDAIDLGMRQRKKSLVYLHGRNIVSPRVVSLQLIMLVLIGRKNRIMIYN